MPLAHKFLAQEVYVFSPLSGIQQRNVEKLLGAKAFVRADLILKIFKKAAISAEGKLQIELTEIKIAKTKLAGMGREMGQ